MLRNLLITAIAVSSLSAELHLNKWYNTEPKTMNNYDVSPRTKHRYTFTFRAIEGYDMIEVKGKDNLSFYGVAKGYDLYTDPNNRVTLRIDRHHNMSIKRSKANGDYIKLNYKLVKVELEFKKYTPRIALLPSDKVKIEDRDIIFTVLDSRTSGNGRCLYDERRPILVRVTSEATGKIHVRLCEIKHISK